APLVPRASLRISQLDHIAVGIGEVCVWVTRFMLAAALQFSARLFDLADHFVEVVFPDREAEMRHSSTCDRIVRLGLAQGDCVVHAGRMKENHLLPFPEFNLETECFLVKLERPSDVPDVEIDVLQSARFDHRRALLMPGLAIRVAIYDYMPC